MRHSFGAFALDVAFKIERPGVTALFGPSGAGKTSVINAIAGLLRPREGRIVIDGRVVLDTECRGVRAAAASAATGYVFQDARLFPHMSVENNLRFGWRRTPNRVGEERDHAHRRSARPRHICWRVHRKRYPAARKAASRLAVRCCPSPDILLLDEPWPRSTRRGASRYCPISNACVTRRSCR